MNRKKVFVLLIIAMLICMTSCGDENKESAKNRRAIKKINEAFEMSFNFASGTLETNILEGSYSPRKAPTKIDAEFNVNQPNKDKNTRNIEFNVVFTYADRQDKVNNFTNYEGLFLNVYYPYTKYNEINIDTVESVKVNKLDEGKEYFVYYNGSHFSRRQEWEYCEVEADYEYFLINEDGVIIEYESETQFKQKDEKTSTLVDGESRLNVKLKDYTLL